MAKRFKFLGSVRKGYKEQGQIFFCCLNYKKQPRATREKIDRLCESIGGQYSAALKEFLTTDADMVWVCDKHFVSQGTMNRLRQRFYEAW